MEERIMHLEDGTAIVAKVNFATLYYMKEESYDDKGRRQKGTDLLSLLKKSEKYKSETIDEEGNKRIELNGIPYSLQVEIAAKMIYVILRSNGLNVDFRDALVLTPIDVGEGSEFSLVFEDFQKKLEDYQKKEKARQDNRKYLAKI